MSFNFLVATVRGFVLAGTIAFGLQFASAEPPPAWPVKQELPAVRLRGYGTLSGALRQSADASASVLEIRCDSEEKAKLVQAKFLSDLDLLGGTKRVELVDLAGKISASEIAGQGSIAALRNAKSVFIFAAASSRALVAIYSEQLPADVIARSSGAETRVPMYLDRWDRHGFRFYYAPWMRPRLADGRDDDNYDTAGDFKFAKDSGHSGIVLWTTPNSVGTAEGINNVPDWDWALPKRIR